MYAQYNLNIFWGRSFYKINSDFHSGQTPGLNSEVSYISSWEPMSARAHECCRIFPFSRTLRKTRYSTELAVTLSLRRLVFQTDALYSVHTLVVLLRFLVLVVLLISFFFLFLFLPFVRAQRARNTLHGPLIERTAKAEKSLSIQIYTCAFCTCHPPSN